MASPQDSTSPSRQHKYVHEMSSSERLESLRAWAEEKKYVIPGESGTLPSLNNGGLASLATGYDRRLSNTMSKTQSNDRYGGQYEAPVGPPSYQVAVSEEEREGGERKRKGSLGRWLEKRKERRREKREGSVPAYVP